MRERNTSSGWTSWEVVYQDAHGEWSIRPVSDAIINSGTDAVGAFNKTSIVEETGWPEAQRLTFTTGKGGRQKTHSRIVKKKDDIWLLKCTKNPWRLYFYVSQNKDREDPNRFIYLHSVYKDQQEEDPADEHYAAGVKRELLSGRGNRIRIAPFAFPPSYRGV